MYYKCLNDKEGLVTFVILWRSQRADFMSGEKWRSFCCTNKMEVFSMIKHSLVADGTNPITKHFKLVRQIGSAGSEMIWKIYEATRISDGHDVSVFVFEKRIADKLHKPRRKEIVSEMLRKDVQHLSRLKHSKILRVIHSLEECHDSLAFATEPVVASLSNLLGNYERMPNPLPLDLKEHSFIDIEIKYGLLQIAEGLSYLHNSEQMMHGNVSPNNIIITKRGTWKLAGFGFAEKPIEGKASPARHIVR
jgi:SCY1-like protein 2